ncbi:hypothetical protein EJ06DRAFT_509928 [Trichodelitschia bisporula]|uniref:Peptidase S54 rhomboid domain-containing protein n=1 Tax=Trichodelitschia bisporula TaxID=703511 RepID=A0A6G1HYK4_9PEZI|nr:hypothetical protein EJ06DRAFT_509928 [Trichodelitschia bisporula]
MITSGFNSAPVSKVLVFWVVASSIVASITDTKYYFYIQIVPHLWGWGQYWRLLAWQTCYTNSTEVLFAATTFYNLRIIERLWGSRKFASFLLLALPYTLLLPPLLLSLLRPLTLGHANYLPAGPTALLFALLAQYHAAIPASYQYRIGTSAAAADRTPSQQTTLPSPSQALNALRTQTITLSSKSLSYLIPLQLALSQFPHTILPAAVGWAVGYAYRNEVLPGTTWRVPGWMVGQEAKSGHGRGGGARQMEILRRRLEGENAAGTPVEGGGEARRRPLARLLGEQFLGNTGVR